MHTSGNHLITFYAETLLPTQHGHFRLRVYRDGGTREPMAIVAGEVRGHDAVPVRVHSACFTSETLGSLRCDCREQLEFALRYINENGGIVLYLHQEGRGIGLGNKVRAYALQQEGYDTVEANEMLGLPTDGRTYGVAALILQDLGVQSIRLMTNNPSKMLALRKLGILIQDRIPVVIPKTEFSASYLETKRSRMGHLLHADLNNTKTG